MNNNSNKNTKQSVNVLYLGMAHDIMAPLLLVPDLDILYVLNSLDEEYGSWEDHKRIIRETLKQGDDKNIAANFWFDELAKQYAPKNKEWKNIHTLAGPSEILSEEDTPSSECLTGSNTHNTFCYTTSVWKLRFLYNGKERQLIYYYNYNYAQYEWPSEIQNIKYYVWNGAYSWESMMEFPEEVKLREMTEKRAAPEAYVFALSWNHKQFPDHMLIYNSHDRYGTEVAKMKLNFSDPNWWKKNYSGGKRSDQKRSDQKRSGKRSDKRNDRKRSDQKRSDRKLRKTVKRKNGKHSKRTRRT